MNYTRIYSTILIALASLSTINAQDFKVKVNTSREPITTGKYSPSWESLGDYSCPEWFSDAKFGIWAHWGPQCQPEYGDWFGRLMYIPDGEWSMYRYSQDSRGPQSQFGFKDWIHEWKGEHWNPEALVKLYKDAGAKYFFAMANHHDNFDLFDSKYQSWNSVDIGPEKDIIGLWADAARRCGLPFGVSVHASHTWTWYETARGCDKTGIFKGIPYDGSLTKADGAGKWWEGLDPQELYEQRHPLSADNGEWEWNENKVTLPDTAYCNKFYNRTMDLINRYNPHLIYFDDTVLPLYPFCDAGLDIAASFYNKSIAMNDGHNEAVIFGKKLDNVQKKAIVQDVERGAPDDIQPLPWQTCTCLGTWHYNKRTYYEDWYKSSQQVIQMLVDVVSKNGNLLLSVPMKGDGTIDATEERIVREIGAWIKINGESIYGTRPWTIYGEGPTVDAAKANKDGNHDEGSSKYSALDIRFATKGGNTLYATVMAKPTGEVGITSLGKNAKILKNRIKKVELLGYNGKLAWQQSSEALLITPPADVPCSQATVFKITLR